MEGDWVFNTGLPSEGKARMCGGGWCGLRISWKVVVGRAQLVNADPSSVRPCVIQVWTDYIP